MIQLVQVDTIGIKETFATFLVSKDQLTMNVKVEKRVKHLVALCVVELQVENSDVSNAINLVQKLIVAL